MRALDKSEIEDLRKYAAGVADRLYLAHYARLGTLRAAAIAAGLTSHKPIVLAVRRAREARGAAKPMTTGRTRTDVPNESNVPKPDRSFVQGRTARAPLMRANTPSASYSGEAPTHLVIPDTQVKPGVPLVHLKWVARYAAHKRPNKIIHLGDHYDLPSLSSYDKGTKRAEGRRLSGDVNAGALALRIFNETLAEHAPGYAPEKIMLTGNHEERLQRHIDASPELDGVLSMATLRREEFGWTTHDFLRPVDIDGVRYSHYFVRNTHGQVMQSKSGQPSAREQVKREAVSCVAGHKQSLDVHHQSYQDGIKTGVIAGSCLTPNHKILTADLRYIPLGDVMPGQQVVSFDENVSDSVGRARRFKTGTVLATRSSPREVMRVEFDDGTVFHATRDHQWLMRITSGTRTQWRTTDSLRVGMRAVRPLDVWDTNQSRDAGYLSGLYDGEGSLYARSTQEGRHQVCQLALSQKPGLVLDEARRVLDSLKLGNTSDVNSRGVATLRLTGGQKNIARLLGTIRPVRLMNKFNPTLLGKVNTTKEQRPRVVSVEPAGVRDIVEIDIDAKTMVVDGFCHHNCYLHQEGYLTPQGDNYWRGVLMLNNVVDGEFALWCVGLDWLCRRYEGKSLKEFLATAKDSELMIADV